MVDMKLSELPDGQLIKAGTGSISVEGEYIYGIGISTTTTIGVDFKAVGAKSVVGSVTTQPTGDSSDVKAGVYGEALHDSANKIVGSGHNMGVIGRGDNINTGSANFIIGVEGRVDCKVGDITVGAAVIATFGTDTDNAGTIDTAVGFYMPNQSDDAHLTNKYAFLNSWAAGLVYTAGDITTLGKINIGKDIDFDATIAGTTGAQTIHKSAGRVTMASGANSLIVTNNLVTADSIILLTLGGLDATAIIPLALADSGYFTIVTNATATADLDINFMVVN